VGDCMRAAAFEGKLLRVVGSWGPCAAGEPRTTIIAEFAAVREEGAALGRSAKGLDHLMMDAMDKMLTIRNERIKDLDAILHALGEMVGEDDVSHGIERLIARNACLMDACKKALAFNLRFGWASRSCSGLTMVDNDEVRRVLRAAISAASPASKKGTH
jgi:hypothetical protein